uniref:Uncharacterized protein n=1 Tax=Rangifer tarandus platyrhynchus TaxID=3082113 RepID=A0ACB0E4V7_RANTA|nr:unnamed protein product [Rangifer tarandus platyrhynchus]
MAGGTRAGGRGGAGSRDREAEGLEGTAALGPSPQPDPGQVRPGQLAAGAPGTAQAAAVPAPARSRPGAASRCRPRLRRAPRPAGQPREAFRGPGSTCRSPATPGDPLIGYGRSPAPPAAAGHSGNCSPPRAARPQATD